MLSPTDLIQLLRTLSIERVRRELDRLYRDDQVFYEKLINFFSRCQQEKKKPLP